MPVKIPRKDRLEETARSGLALSRDEGSKAWIKLMLEIDRMSAVNRNPNPRFDDLLKAIKLAVEFSNPLPKSRGKDLRG